MSAIAFRLPVDGIGEAVAEGGKACPSLGEGWVFWEGDWALDVKRWCKAAHDYASRK